jgi:hypothetical protein
MRFLALLVAVLLQLAACTGAPPQTQPTDRPTPAADTSPTAPGQPTPPAQTPPAQAASPGTGEQPPTTGICTLLPAADVSTVVGMPATVAPDQDDPTNCLYNIGDPGELIPEYAVSVRLEAGDFTGPKAAFPGGQDIGDIGDGAYWAPGVTTLWFLRGGQMYTIQLVLFGEDDGDALAIARGLAEAVLSRL